jgi:hypothetical protein
MLGACGDRKNSVLGSRVLVYKEWWIEIDYFGAILSVVK